MTLSRIAPLAAMAAALIATAAPAHAYWRGGVFVDVPLVAPPPVVYAPPPVVYAPPPVVYAPPPPVVYAPPPVAYARPPVAYPAPSYTPTPPTAQTQTAATAPRGYTCYAGVYVCAVPGQAMGSGCSCPGLGAPSYGTVR